MFFYVFITLCIIVNLLLCFLIHFKRYRFSLTYPLFGLAFLFPLNSLIGNSLWSNTAHLFGISGIFASNLYIATYITSTLLLKDFLKGFLRKGELKLSFSFFKIHSLLSLLLSFFGIGAVIISLFTPIFELFVNNDFLFLVLSTVGTFTIFIQLIIILYTLFILENTYRFCQDYQRKIARLCFLALCIITVFQLFFSCYLLLYKILNPNLTNIASVAYGVTYPVLLIGLLRYRLNTEHIAVPRNAVYSTVSLLLSGAAFLGIGTTVIVFKLFKINFNYFEAVLLIFSFCLSAVLVIGSGSMRKRISRFINNYFYLHKFDYREQFFNLHRSYMTGENVKSTLTEIIENMKYSVEADDAFIFLTNESDGHLYMHENKESATAPNCVIRGDSHILRELSQTHAPINLQGRFEKTPSQYQEVDERLFRETIKTDIIFPIVSHRIIFGILALRLLPNVKIDTEGTMLIEVFAKSIGDVLYKNKVLTESVERKQFESFSHMSSFIIHDIKNQIATLSLLVRNAGNNITNPDFQKSLLSSLQSCTGNLQHLIDKLKSPPKLDTLKMRRLDVNTVVDRVVENTGTSAISQVRLVLKKGPVGESEIDEESLFYIIKNLLLNALDAMNYHGILTIWTGRLAPDVPAEFQQLFNSSKVFFAEYNTFIMVSDTGCGITPEFINNKLFHPFFTTKDKGIGIGLYQCKILIEKMGGKILCHSVMGRGTDFCIVL